MKVLDCNNTSVTIIVPPCAGDTPVAELQRANHVTVPLTGNAEGDFTFPSPFPANIPFPARGVWRLSVNTGCGCYEANVYVDCPAPMFESRHEGSLVGGPSTECCVDENDILLHVTALAPPSVEVDGYPTATLLVDEAASYAFRLNDALMTGPYTITNESGVELAAGTFGALGTTQYHDLDLTCTTYVLKLPNPEPV